MAIKKEPKIPGSLAASGQQVPATTRHSKREMAIRALVLIFIFTLGGGSGYLAGHRIKASVTSGGNASSGDEEMALLHQINPPKGYKIPAIYGDIGPQLVEAGAIDLSKLRSIYRQQNKQLSDEQLAILTVGSVAEVEINPDNANFVLNFFWAVGLTNDNPIITAGKMVSRGRDKAGDFASTGGWTLGTELADQLYASHKIIHLDLQQQSRLDEVAGQVFRPCCNNATDFPDCNHGMAMLGLFELMSSQNATVEQMFETAKYVNAFWFPQQMLEVATAIKASQDINFSDADARLVTGNQYFSGAGFQNVHRWLAGNGLLPQTSSVGGSCAVY